MDANETRAIEIMKRMEQLDRELLDLADERPALTREELCDGHNIHDRKVEAEVSKLAREYSNVDTDLLDRSDFDGSWSGSAPASWRGSTPTRTARNGGRCTTPRRTRLLRPRS